MSLYNVYNVKQNSIFNENGNIWSWKMVKNFKYLPRLKIDTAW